MGDVIGTHLHGPVLAKNPSHGRRDPRASAAERAGLAYAPGPQAAVVDAYAEAAQAGAAAGRGRRGIRRG